MTRISHLATWAVLAAFALSTSAVAAGPLINEFMASNVSTLADQDGDYSDWIELYNPDAVDVDLGGWYLTDKTDNLTKWEIPSVILPAGGYMVIFASEKDLIDPGDELHTNFKLGASGEYLALVQPDGVTIAHDYAPAAQSADVSYGLMGVSVVYFDTATPGEPNDGTPIQLATVDFSADRGFYDAPFDLTLTTASLGTTIAYTLDGTDPNDPASNTQTYAGPIHIDATTVVRAASTFGSVTSVSVTQTYIFLGSVLTQGNDQTAIGFPDVWHAGAGGSGIYDYTYRDADYEMDPDIVNDPVWGPQLEEALLSIPSMALTMNPEDLWDSDTGIYPNSIQRASSDPLWEKSGSLELIDPDGGGEFQINAGARIMGELARWAAVNDKQSFRIVFQQEYGPGKLVTDFFGDPDVDQYDTIVLRAHWGKSWLNDEVLGDLLGVSWLNSDPSTAQYLRDLYAHQTFADTGNLSSDGRFIHLYLNGVYWGLYEVVERPDNSFNAEHLGGDKDDFNVVKGAVGDSWNFSAGKYVQNPKQNGRLQDGSRAMWDWLFDVYFDADSDGINRTSRNAVSDAELAVIGQYLDLDQFTDYMITLWTLNRGDFPQKNWYAAWEGGGAGTPPATPIQFYVWDSEASLEYGTWTAVVDRWNNPAASNDTGPVRIYWRLITNESFRLRWADRAAELLGEGGPLSADAMVQRYVDLADQIDIAVIAESARWGDSSTLHIDDPMTKADWDIEYDHLVGEWLPERTALTIAEMRSVGLMPATKAPTFTESPGVVPAGLALEMRNPNAAGVIWYTLDGSDPADPAAAAIEFETLPGFEATAVGTGDDWLYDDSGVDLGAAWSQREFDDSQWSQGAAQLGYGDGDEATTIGYGPNSADKNMTTYFRHGFNVDSAAMVSSLTGSLLVDDAAVIYINGQEVYRVNMPDGEIDYTTAASSTVSREGEVLYRQFSLGAAAFDALVDGYNVIAVEVHQDMPYGSDLSFDLSLDVASAGLGLTPILLNADTHIVARVNNGGQWSTKTEGTFIVDEAPVLIVTEMDYHPADPSAIEMAAGFDNSDTFEFLELFNPGAEPVTQIGAAFVDAIDAVLPAFTLMPGEYGVVVDNLEAFEFRYGPGINILGEYGGQLDNAGERVAMASSNGAVIIDFVYSDDDPWPTQADGLGLSLNLLEPALDPNDAASWVPAAPSPGKAGRLTGIEGDLNGDDVVDAADIDALFAAIRAGSIDPLYDLNGDGSLDKADADYLVGTVLGTGYGDANLDGQVNLEDFVSLKKSFGKAGGWANGDITGDGQVGLEDFVEFKKAF